MSGAREEILGRIRAALDHAQPPPDQGAEAEWRLSRRLSHPRPNLVPERGRGNELAQQFISEMERVDGTTARVTALAGAPRAIAAFLAENSLPGTLKVAPDPLLKNLPWRDEKDLSVEFGRAYDRDPVGVSAAFAGVAETGTLMLVSGADGPVTVSFLPDTHIVVLPVWRLAGAYEDAWARLRGEAGEGDAFMPRTVNWITGPSRTADIEQSLLLGAHGPRRLHVILVEGDG